MHVIHVDTSYGRVVCHESAGKGQPVVLLHYNSGSSELFTHQLNGDLGRKYRLISIDFPGHGKSPRPKDPELTYSLPGYAKVLLEILKKLQLESAFMVGISLGGHVLLEASPSLPLAKGFIISGTAPMGWPAPLTQAWHPHPILEILFKPAFSENDLNIAESGIITSKSKPAYWVRDDLTRTDGRARERLGQSIAAGNYADEVKILENLPQPIALFHGARDAIIRLDYLQSLNIPTLWRKQVQIITEAGHALPREEPEAFDQLLEYFINDHS